MSAVMTVTCLVPDCHGMLSTRQVKDVAEWDTKHKSECPTPEPRSLADVRSKLRDLEECDDPDYEDWCTRVDKEFMPLITAAANLMVSDTQDATGETR